jgi:hypothetical protein
MQQQGFVAPVKGVSAVIPIMGKVAPSLGHSWILCVAVHDERSEVALCPQAKLGNLPGELLVGNTFTDDSCFQALDSFGF